MYNNNADHPRISFSNDFVESLHSRPQILKTTRDYNTPVSSDFEFSVSGNNMMTADELFFKGRLLPFKNNAGSVVVGQKTTLRDELLAGEDDDGCGGGGGGGGVSSGPPKASSTRWKGFLGLRKSHIGSKKSDKGDGSRFGAGSGSGSGSGQDDVHVSKTSQEMINQGGGTSNCRDMESRMR